MMKIKDIKVGMNVRRTKDMSGRSREYPKGYTFTVKNVFIGSLSVECDRGAYHDIRNLESTDLEIQLTAAQAEVERIKAAIRDRDMPKVGDVITWGDLKKMYHYTVHAVDGDHIACAQRNLSSGAVVGRYWFDISQIFLRHDFEFVSRASTS